MGILERPEAEPTWGQVAAAIALVADAGYPRVAVTGVTDARAVAVRYRPDAERRGVSLLVERAPSGAETIVVSRAVRA